MARPRTLDEIKDGIRDRIGKRAPFIHADRQEAEQALARLNGIDPESWAGAWNEIAERWEEKAREAEAAGNSGRACEAFLKAYGYYGIARHPFPNSAGKQRAYVKTREMYLAASRYFEIPIERVTISFEGKEIIGHLRLPKKVPAPLIMHWGGGIHYFFQPEWQEKSRHAPSYLFDLIEARANLFGKKTFDELIKVMPALSLKTQGWLERPCAPLLLANGKEDRQVPIEDFYLLLETGDPKTARFFPGGHMGSIQEISRPWSNGSTAGWTGQRSSGFSKPSYCLPPIA